ncbi:MAG: hypothetical protein JWL62_2030 [Hyphomicrobiales bacterium]|nr:hypothetical protein [Hyphomicrobiales bacterium]
MQLRRRKQCIIIIIIRNAGIWTATAHGVQAARVAKPSAVVDSGVEARALALAVEAGAGCSRAENCGSFFCF